MRLRRRRRRRRRRRPRPRVWVRVRARLRVRVRVRVRVVVAGVLAQQALRHGEGGGAAHDVAERLETQLETEALVVVRVDEQHVHVGDHEVPPPREAVGVDQRRRGAVEPELLRLLRDGGRVVREPLL